MPRWAQAESVIFDSLRPVFDHTHDDSVGFAPLVLLRHASPRLMNVDKNPAYPAAMEALQADGTIPRRVA